MSTDKNEPAAQPLKSQPVKTIRTRLIGYELLNDRRLNKGTAFTESERDIFSLHGLLPPHVGTLREQVDRRRKALSHIQDSFDRYSFMRDLQDQNETLFYALIAQNVEESLPIVYTPAVGEGCQRFSEVWRKPRGVFLSYPNKDRIDRILSHPHFDPVRCIVVSDGERILGLGDQGAGGMGIPIGKMALYTALGGIAHSACLPILLDVGTDNEERLSDPLYIGWQHHRVRGQDYDDFIDAFVAAVKHRWPRVLLQWEDFSGANAMRLLARYRNELCTFNDDIQGTAAVVTGTLLAAVNAGGVPIHQHRIAVVGFGAAGIGIANLLLSVMRDAGLSEEEARDRFYAIDRLGLLTEDSDDLRPDQAQFVRTRESVAGWKQTGDSHCITLPDVMRNAKPTVLIGVSAQAGAFTEEAVREMARHTARPIIFPLSNPTSRSEARPQDLMDWTEGRALIGSGSPFGPVRVGGELVRIDQTNNSYIFPGLALGIVSARAARVSDGMIKAAALALAGLSPAVSSAGEANPRLLPPLADIRSVSRTVAIAVGKQAIAEGLAAIGPADFEKELAANIWEPVYLPYELETEDRDVG